MYDNANVTKSVNNLVKRKFKTPCKPLIFKGSHFKIVAPPVPLTQQDVVHVLILCNTHKMKTEYILLCTYGLFGFLNIYCFLFQRTARKIRKYAFGTQNIKIQNIGNF